MSDSFYYMRAILVIPLIVAFQANSSVIAADECQSAKTKKAATTRDGQPGETMAIVGSFDVDGDGISDRKIIHEHLAAAGASIDIEVDDNGVRRPKSRTIDSRTSFLVVGTLVDPATITDPAKRKIAERVAQHYLTMRAEARKAGVRTVYIGDFLTFGSPHRNRWRPSMSGSNEKPYHLKSGVYGRSKRLKQPKSSGQASKLFPGGSPYDKQVDIPK